MPLLHRLRILVCAIAAVATAGSAAAATIQVTSTADSGAGSLRDALAAATAGDTITFALRTPATISLTSGSLEVTKDLTIAGPGAAQVTVNRDATATLFGVFSVADGVTATISGITISGGDATDYYFGSSGAGIANAGNLTVSKVLLTHNRSYYGTIWNDYHANLTLVDSTIIDNEAVDPGYYDKGVVWACCDAGSVTIRRSTISSRSTPNAAALVIFSGYNGGTITTNIENSTIDGSIVSEWGRSSLMVNSSTISTTDGGDLFRAWYGDSVTTRNSILAAGTGVATIGYGMTGTSLGFNLFSDAAGAAVATDQTSTDAKLGPLQDNDGPTPTHALLPGSAAIDTGSCTDSAGATVATDQRGIARPRGNACDIGAFESASNIERQVDRIAQTVAATLDTAVGSRASQSSVDQLDSKVLTIDGHLMTDVLPAVQALGTALTVVSTQVAGVSSEVLGVSSSVADVLAALGGVSSSVNTRATQASVDALNASTTAGLTSVSASVQSLTSALPPANAFSTLQSTVDGVGTSVAARATQVSVDAIGRYAIERALLNGDRVATFFLPATAGGQLEAVRAIVNQTLAGLKAIGVSTTKAAASLSKGDAAYAAGDYRTAYDYFAYAYQLLVK